MKFENTSGNKSIANKRKTPQKQVAGSHEVNKE
jgi:hypothetical protein